MGAGVTAWELDLSGGVDRVVAVGALVGIQRSGPVEGLKGGDVGGRELLVILELIVHRRPGIRAVAQAEDVPRLMQHHRVEIEPFAAEVVVGVYQNVAAPGAGERGIVGHRYRQLAGSHGLGADADIAEPRVVLGRPRGAESLAAIAHQSDVDVRLDGPGLKGLENLFLPDGGRLPDTSSVWNNELVWEAIAVPSGAKLSVSRLGSAHGTPKVAGTARTSRNSRTGLRRLCFVWLSMAHTSRLI